MQLQMYDKPGPVPVATLAMDAADQAMVVALVASHQQQPLLIVAQPHYTLLAKQVVSANAPCVCPN